MRAGLRAAERNRRGLYHAEFRNRTRDIEYVVALGHEQFEIEDVAAENAAVDIESRGGFVELIFPRLQVAAPQSTGSQKYPTLADYALAREFGSNLAGPDAAREFDKHGLREAFVGLGQPVHNVAACQHRHKETKEEQPQE